MATTVLCNRKDDKKSPPNKNTKAAPTTPPLSAEMKTDKKPQEATGSKNVFPSDEDVVHTLLRQVWGV